MAGGRTIDCERRQVAQSRTLKASRAILLFLLAHYTVTVAWTAFVIYGYIMRFHATDEGPFTVMLSLVAAGIVFIVPELLLLCMMHVVLGIQSGGRRGIVIAVRRPWRFLVGGAVAAAAVPLGLWGMGHCANAIGWWSIALLTLGVHPAAGLILFATDRICATNSMPRVDAG